MTRQSRNCWCTRAPPATGHDSKSRPGSARCALLVNRPAAPSTRPGPAVFTPGGLSRYAVVVFPVYQRATSSGTRGQGTRWCGTWRRRRWLGIHGAADH